MDDAETLKTIATWVYLQPCLQPDIELFEGCFVTLIRDTCIETISKYLGW